MSTPFFMYPLNIAVNDSMDGPASLASGINLETQSTQRNIVIPCLSILMNGEASKGHVAGIVLR